MDIKFVTTPVDQIEAETLVVLAFEKEKDSPPAPDSARLADEKTQGWISDLYASGEFSGKLLELAVLHRPADLKAKRLAVAGCGPQAKFGSAELRKVAGAALRNLKGRSAREIAFLLDPALASADNAAAVVEGAVLGDFEPDAYKTDPKKNERAVERFSIAVPGGAADLEAALHRGRVLAEAQNFTRSLVNEPGNRLTPTVLAERARQTAAELGLDCDVLDRDRMAQLGMGALLGVAQGSAEPPALIVLRYEPPAGAAREGHLGLVGKGVTFDTGGVSIKPADGMEKMKYDMAGAGAVLGAMRAIAQLKPPVRVTALIPTVENMVGSRAQRPGDIVTSLSGKTIEVLNTDAEGRLILADAITYAIRLGCTHLVDAATLTGAIVVALGHVNVGAFTNNDDFSRRVLDAARAEGEKMWPMPLDDDYKEYLRSAFADIPNIGGRWGGAVTAAMFLKEFVEDKPWVHLDIAGTAWLDDGKPFLAKGPSGVAVRTFAKLAESW
ncbi:MAG: leucyl aminopeptidase [Bryobacteraceae bacterium]